MKVPNKERIKCIFYDFDGVMTDNTVWVQEDGKETVRCNRSDGLAVGLIRNLGINQVIVSTEKKPIVVKRADKLGLEVFNSVNDKAEAIKEYCDYHHFDLESTMFIGNDINDLTAMQIVGVKGCPADAEIEIKELADWISNKNGGYGVIRDLYRCLINDED